MNPKFKWIPCMIIVFIMASNTILKGQCYEFYGMTSDGGNDNGGTIFRTTGYGDSLITCYSAVFNAEGSSPYGQLCKADNGKFYGTTYSGGINYVGVLFEWDPSTNNYIKKHDFDGPNTGGWPQGSLMQALNGKLYGVTSYGGSHNCGVLFEWDPETDVFTKKIDCGIYWANPGSNLVQANNGKIYGTTQAGGNYNMGLIFAWDPESNVIEDVFSFDGTEIGKGFVGSLVKDTSGHLYGMTSLGGANDLGVLFELDPESGAITKKMDFSGIETGSRTYGSLVITAMNKLYGLAGTGGANQLGTLFEYNLVTDSFSRKFDFDTLNGIHPSRSLIQASNGNLYGTTAKGGLYNWGVLFEWDPVTEVFTKKVDFNDYGKGYDRGNRSALTQGMDGSLYGVTSDAGRAGVGTLYEWNYETEVIVDRLDFDYALDGSHLKGSLVQAGHGKLYGTAFNGGLGNNGVLFEWDPVTKLYVKKIDFSKKENGKMPFSLTMAKNGKFYGMTLAGGVYGQGVIFEWDIRTNTYTKIIDFSQTITGMYPVGKLLLADNGKLYGLTKHGEKIDGGVLFELDPETNTYMKRFEFGDAIKGFWPEGSLVQADNGRLYGTTERGGLFEGGVLFEWDPGNGKYTKKFDFDAKGYYPDGSLIKGSNGKLYGMTDRGGKSDVGILFEYDIKTNVCSKKFDLALVIEGQKLLGYLLQASNGKIYGMAYTEGSMTRSTLFEYDPATNIVIKKYDFTKKSGITPSGNLVEIGNNRCSFSVLNEIACDEYNFNGRIIYESGMYFDTIPNAAGCDSLITLNLTILKSALNTLFETACSEYHFNGRLLKTSGTYFDKLPNAAGCDSIIVLFLTILQPSYSSPVVTACNEYLFGDKIIRESGIYQDTIVNVVGCDSVITLHLSIIHGNAAILNVSACGYFTSPSGKNTWTSSGTYTDTIPNQVGCDSIITINLTVSSGSENAFSTTTCNSFISPSGKYVWTTSGIYTDTIPNSSGCDSLISINLTVNHSTASLFNTAVCDIYTSPSGRYTWTSGGTYLDTIPNVSGCDSVITIELQIDHVDTTVIQDRTVLISNDINALHQWIDCDDGDAIIDGETFFTYTAKKNGHYAVIVTQGTCVDTSTFYSVVVTGITEPTTSQITVYPNPTSGSFTIDLGRTCPDAVVIITSMDGQLIQQENIHNAQIIEQNLSAPPGIYTVKIATEREVAVVKLIRN